MSFLAVRDTFCGPGHYQLLPLVWAAFILKTGEKTPQGHLSDPRFIPKTGVIDPGLDLKQGLSSGKLSNRPKVSERPRTDQECFKFADSAPGSACKLRTESCV